jgi:hypothetical protein
LPGRQYIDVAVWVLTAADQRLTDTVEKHLAKGGPGLRLFYRLVPNSAISIEYLWNIAIRLLVNSAMTLRISTGDLIVASL